MTLEEIKQAAAAAQFCKASDGGSCEGCPLKGSSCDDIVNQALVEAAEALERFFTIIRKAVFGL